MKGDKFYFRNQKIWKSWYIHERYENVFQELLEMSTMVRNTESVGSSCLTCKKNWECDYKCELLQ